MIIVHGTFLVKPEVRDDALEMMRQMALASRSEHGCITYEFYMGVTDPNTMLLFQEWDSVEALEDHFDTAHMEEFVRHLPQVLNGEVATRRYEVRVNREETRQSQDVDSVSPEIETREKIVH